MVNIGQLTDSFLIGNLRFTDIRLNLKLTHQAVNDDFQMELTHAGDDGLTSFLVGVGSEGRVFFRELGKSDRHFFLTGLCFRLDCQVDNGFGELHRFQNDRMLGITEGVAGGRVFQAHRGVDIARIAYVDIFSVVRVHLKDTAHALRISLAGIEYGSTCFNGTRIDAEEAKLSDVGVGSNLERQCRKRRVVARRSCFLFLRIRVGSLDVGNIGRSGHIVHNRVKQLLHTLVLIRGTAADRHHLVGNGGLADHRLDLFNGDFLTAKIFFHQGFVLLGKMLQQFLAILLSKLHHIFWNCFLAHVLAHVIIIDVGFHFHEVDNPSEKCFGADRQLDGNSITFQTLFHHADYAIEIRAHDVHLVDIAHTGNIVFVRLTPYGFRLRLNAALCTENGYRAVEHFQRALNLHGEVNVSGGVDDIDSVAFPVGGGSSGGNGNTSLLLLRHPVHCRRALMHLADLMVDTCVIQDTLGRGGFAGVNVGHYADITCKIQRDVSWHSVLPFDTPTPRQPGAGVAG